MCWYLRLDFTFGFWMFSIIFWTLHSFPFDILFFLNEFWALQTNLNAFNDESLLKCLVIFDSFAVNVDQKGKTLEISAEYKASPRKENLLKEVHSTKKFCPKCTLGLDIKHTDVLILQQYLRSDGTMLPRRITGLCAIQQKNIGTMVLMARRAGTYLFWIFFHAFADW